MAIGIRTAFVTAANQLFTSNVVLASIGLISAMQGNGQAQKFRAWIPFSVGATGGIRLQVQIPAGGTVYRQITIILRNNITQTTTAVAQLGNPVFTNAIANAGTHYIEVEGIVVVPALTGAGNIDIQIAQNTSDPLTLTILRGAQMEVTKL